jgi:hypothetical protein
MAQHWGPYHALTSGNFNRQLEDVISQDFRFDFPADR